MADLHDQVDMLDYLNGIDFDLVVFCGDLHNGSDRELAMPVAETLSKLGPRVLIVPGNMDRKDVVPDLWNEVGLINIHRGSYHYRSFGFIGMGGMVVRNPNRLGDPLRYYHLDDDVYQSLSKAYSDILRSVYRVVVTHQPPREALDTIYSGERTGSVGLRKFVEGYRPDLLLCGHIHEDRGKTQIGSTEVVNVGEMRKGYAAIIDINEKIEVRWIEP